MSSEILEGRTLVQQTETAYGIAEALPHKFIVNEAKVNVKTVTRFSQEIILLVSQAHDIRWLNAGGTVNYMQKDETCTSKVKRGGCNRSHAVRKQGHRWFHTLVVTNVTDQAQEVFVKSLANRSESTMTLHVLHLAAGTRTVVKTDGWRARLALGSLVNHKFINHRVEWVTSEGVSTNTVESMNNQLKVELKCRANRLGIEDDDREEKRKFLTECVNGKLKVNGWSFFFYM